MIDLRPVTLAQCNAHIVEHHRHHDAVITCIMKCGAYVGGVLDGVVVVEPTRAQALRNGTTFEVTRLCCTGNHRDVGSRLLGAAWGAMRAQGVRRLISYTRVDEGGGVYRAAGWVATHITKAGSWDHGAQALRWLPGTYEPATEIIDRVRWEIGPDAAATRVRCVDGKWVKK